MRETQCIRIAHDAFRQIQERFPALEMNVDECSPVELEIDIPVQPGLKYAVNINLQNHDELHFSVENFWLEWFPCSDRSRVEGFVDAVCGFISGKYRILEHYRGKRCVKAELQAPMRDGGWDTIGTSAHPDFPWPLRKACREIINL